MGAEVEGMRGVWAVAEPWTSVTTRLRESKISQVLQRRDGGCTMLTRVEERARRSEARRSCVGHHRNRSTGRRRWGRHGKLGGRGVQDEGLAGMEGGEPADVVEGALGVGAQEAVGAHLLEFPGEHMLKEAAQKLLGR
jgi:hypothetical protein